MIRPAPKIGSIHNSHPVRLRPRRAISRAKLTSEYSMAATGPRRPRHSKTTGSKASSQNHSGCRNRVTRPLIFDGLFRFGRFKHESASALTQRLHVLRCQRLRRELDEIALVEKIAQESLMPRQRGI